MSWLDDDKKTKRRTFRSHKHPRTIMLDDDRMEYVLEVGEDNISEGIRRCIDEHRERHAKPIDIPDIE